MINNYQEFKRIFIALPISNQFTDLILNFQNKFKKLPFRWIKKENLHITLIPPWYEKNIDLVKKQIKTLENQIDSFKIQFNLIEYGPNKFRPRLVWIIGKNNEQILNLRLNLIKILNKNELDYLDFKVHLTIARFNYNNKMKLPNISKNIFWQEDFLEFVLMESNLLKTGAEYKILEKVNFKR